MWRASNAASPRSPAAPTFRRVFPARSSELRSIRRSASAWLDRNRIDASRRDDVIAVLGEACSNAIEHAYCDTGAGMIEVAFALDHGLLTAQVRDAGTWRHGPPSEGRGCGSSIMGAFSDDWTRSSGRDGTVMRCEFRDAVGVATAG